MLRRSQPVNIVQHFRLSGKILPVFLREEEPAGRLAKFYLFLQNSLLTVMLRHDKMLFAIIPIARYRADALIEDWMKL